MEWRHENIRQLQQEQMEREMEREIREYEREKEDQIRKLENTVKQLLAGKKVTVFVPVRRLWVYFNKSVKLSHAVYACGLILVVE